MKAAHTIPFAARSRSASRQTIAGSLPPSSRRTGVRFFAAAAMTFFPVATLPVKTIFPIRGSSTRDAATASSVARTFTTPSGKPAFRASAPIRSPAIVVAGAGLSTTVFPAASAEPTTGSDWPHG